MNKLMRWILFCVYFKPFYASLFVTSPLNMSKYSDTNTSVDELQSFMSLLFECMFSYYKQIGSSGTETFVFN